MGQGGRQRGKIKREKEKTKRERGQKRQMETAGDREGKRGRLRQRD